MSTGMDKRTKAEMARAKRRRKRLIFFIVTRSAVVVGALLIVILLGYGMVKGVRSIVGSDEPLATKEPETTATPKETFESVEVPPGYKGVFADLLELYETHPEIDFILFNLEEYPKELLQLLASNVETLDFVKAYPDNVGKTEVGKIKKSEIKDGKIPLFLQWDERWGYLEYGGGMIALNGCGPTCLSMVVAGLTGNREYTPKAIADYSMENNYYAGDAGTAWALMSRGSADFGVTPREIGLDKDAITAQLEEGHPVICSVKPGDFTTQGHYIVLTGVTKKGKWKVNDPNSIANSSKNWEPDRVLSQIQALWAFSPNS